MAEHFRIFAEFSGIECLLIDLDTKLTDFMNALKWNNVYYQFTRGLR